MILRPIATVALSLLLCAATVTSGCSKSQQPRVYTPMTEALPEDDAAFLRTLEAELHESRGAERLRLRRSAALDEVARKHAEDMAKKNYFSHRSPDGTLPADRTWRDRPELVAANISENLYVYRTNIPEAAPQRAAIANRGFLDSPSHRENMLSNERTHVGLGVARIKRDGLMAEYTVQVFARNLGVWEENPSPQVDGSARELVLRHERTDVEFYVFDLDHPNREYATNRSNMMTVGGFFPEVVRSNDRTTLRIMALKPGTYRLGARFEGEDGYTGCAPDFTVVAPK